MQNRGSYLDALGVEQWVSRGGAAVADPLLATPVAPQAPAAPAPPAAVRASQATPVTPAASGEPAWLTLQAQVAACQRCALHAGRLNTVFGVGNPGAQWMVIGEAPGAEEDKQGEPFVGRAGQLLNAMLLAIGLPREQVFIANILKCRPPGNRDPLPQEVAECLPYLERQIALIKPRILLAVGRIAAQNLLATDTPIGKLRGQLHRFGAAQTPLVVTYHPAYLLRSPGEKRKAWDDLKFARRVHRELGQAG